MGELIPQIGDRTDAEAFLDDRIGQGVKPGVERIAGLMEFIGSPELTYPSILIAGTNGKTTTTMLLAHLLQTSGMRAGAGGNVGGGLAPPASVLALLDPAPDWYVLEMSSFQIAGIDTFRPQIGVVTNLSPDHLDRYRSVEEYYADKARIADNADAETVWVLPADDRAVEELLSGAPGHRFYFGESASPEVASREMGGRLTLDTGTGEVELIERLELPLLGRHNVRNALAAALAASLAGASVDGIAKGLRTARALPHRMEPVLEAEGVHWVNDS